MRLQFRDRSVVRKVQVRLWRSVLRYPEPAFLGSAWLSRLVRPGKELPIPRAHARDVWLGVSSSAKETSE